MARRLHATAVASLAAGFERGGVEAELAHPPLLIVGAPRSGTSLATQTLVAGLDIGWFSGWHNVAAGAPGIVSTRWLGDPATHFTSDHGRTPSLREPHEGATWWYRFFPRDQHALRSGGVAQADLDTLRRSVGSVLGGWDRPVVWKNVVNSVRLEPILDALPEAIVIELDRDRTAVAASVRRARVAETGDDRTWWSVRPARCSPAAMAPLDPDDQIFAQLDGVRDALAHTRTNRPGQPWIRVNHADLIADPREVVEAVAAVIERETGVDRRRSSGAIPTDFHRDARRVS